MSQNYQKILVIIAVIAIVIVIGVVGYLIFANRPAPAENLLEPPVAGNEADNSLPTGDSSVDSAPRLNTAMSLEEIESQLAEIDNSLKADEDIQADFNDDDINNF